VSSSFDYWSLHILSGTCLVLAAGIVAVLLNLLLTTEGSNKGDDRYGSGVVEEVVDVESHSDKPKKLRIA
jgi:hypothetical protein